MTTIVVSGAYGKLYGDDITAVLSDWRSNKDFWVTWHNSDKPHGRYTSVSGVLHGYIKPGDVVFFVDNVHTAGVAWNEERAKAVIAKHGFQLHPELP